MFKASSFLGIAMKPSHLVYPAELMRVLLPLRNEHGTTILPAIKTPSNNCLFQRFLVSSINRYNYVHLVTQKQRPNFHNFFHRPCPLPSMAAIALSIHMVVISAKLLIFRSSKSRFAAWPCKRQLSRIFPWNLRVPHWICRLGCVDNMKPSLIFDDFCNVLHTHQQYNIR